ncbi:MAG: VIT1/CCC1 transporter family protein [Candidatus Bathyarchaeia archaeon]
MSDIETEKTILTAQKNEITEHFIYEKLAQSIKDPHNKEVLKRISDDELEHYGFWKGYTQRDVKPDKLKIWKYFLISRIFGITFGIKLMEKGEEKAQVTYEKISEFLPDAKGIVKDEDEHERQLMDLIDEERLRYVGSMVLGLNDALVELTGALAGFTLALQNTRLVAMTGLITGVAASLSMATSEYLSTKSEGNAKNPLKAATYTGIAYVLTVLFLISPYLLLTDAYACLGLTILAAIIVIFLFTFYISVAKDLPFKSRFLEMTLISLGIAGITFIIGFLIKASLNIEV